MNLSSDAYHEYMEQIARQLSDIIISEFSQAERNIFAILCEAGYMDKCRIGEEWVAKRC